MSASVSLNPEVMLKVFIASKKLGVSVSTIVNQAVEEWLKNNKLSSISVDDIVSEYDKALEGYAHSTKKSKLRDVKRFLAWCEQNNIVPDDQAVEKFLASISEGCKPSYVTHLKSTLKDFVKWFSSSWAKHY